MEQLQETQPLVSPDRHKWENNVCVRCQCHRRVFYGCYMYWRSGITFGYERPDCIDWDIENAKTID